MVRSILTSQQKGEVMWRFFSVLIVVRRNLLLECLVAVIQLYPVMNASDAVRSVGKIVPWKNLGMLLSLMLYIVVMFAMEYGIILGNKRLCSDATFFSCSKPLVWYNE